MAFGKSIRIYLKDGTVTGMKFGEVVNHTIQCIACPRLKASELTLLSEARRPGVYFLFGKDEETNEDKVYIGEAENVLDRLQSHLVQKGFWNEVVFFISKDENLTKAHVKYLESRIVDQAHVAKRYKVENSNQPQLPSLPLADRDAMEEFLQQVKMLIGVFGYKVMEKIVDYVSPQKIQVPIGPINIQQATTTEMATDNNKTIELNLSVSSLNAKAVQTNEGLVVLAGSDATANITDSLSIGYRDFRQNLIDSGSLTLAGDRYQFQKDVLFSSPSSAAAIIVGYSANGMIAWRDVNGRTLKVIEQEKIRKTKQLRLDDQEPMM